MAGAVGGYSRKMPTMEPQSRYLIGGEAQYGMVPKQTAADRYPELEARVCGESASVLPKGLRDQEDAQHGAHRAFRAGTVHDVRVRAAQVKGPGV